MLPAIVSELWDTAPMLFTEPNRHQQKKLLHVARQAIELKLTDKHSAFEPQTEDKELQRDGASFASIYLNGELRGCIGALIPHQPLIRDVAYNAVAAATRDLRFTPITVDELNRCVIEISMLTPMMPMDVNSEQDLLSQLRPYVDGLLIDDGSQRATFLPKVWQQLTSPQDFIRRLKIKAGIGPSDWPASIKCFRYHAFDFGDLDSAPI